jgi:uncharacterized membrane protein
MEKNSKKIIRLAQFLLPFIVGFGVYGIWWIIDNEISKIWPFVIGYFFPPLGKESVIPLATGYLTEGMTVPFINIHLEPSNIGPFEIAFAIAFVDIVVAWFLVWNYDLAKKIPFVGKFMIKVEKIGQGSSDKYGWFKPLRFFGIILFVMIPFQGSGGLVGSIVGRLFGMKPWNAFFAISIGAIIGCTLIAYFTNAILSIFETYFLQGIFIILILAIIGIMYFIYRKNKKK